MKTSGSGNIPQEAFAAVLRSCQGEFGFQYGDGEDSIRVSWTR